MTPYELADALQETEPYYLTDEKLFDNAANMLRQQADRIEKLEELLREYTAIKMQQQNRIAELEKQSEPDCYGDGNVYRGGRSKDSEIQTITYTTPQTKPCNGFCGEQECKENQANCNRLKTKLLSDEEIMDELVKVKHTWVATTKVWFEFEKEELLKAIRAIEAKVRGQ